MPATINGRKLTPAQFKKALKHYAQIESLRNDISDAKDKLQEEFSQLEDLLMIVNDGLNDIDSGLEYLKTGLEVLSQQL